MLLANRTQMLGPALEGASPGAGAWAAVLLVSLSTLAGAWLARRNSTEVTVWLAIASAMMLITALADLLPDAWRDAAETGVPLWAVGLAIAFGFLVITYFTRKGCGHRHGHEGSTPAGGRHAPGLHRRVKEAVDVALFGGMGTAAALTLHRAIEGATLALSASAVVVIALMVHSAGEGLALAALLDMAKQRLAPWLVVSCASPAAGVLIADIAPLPAQIVPILLGMVTGVLLRTALVGLRLAAAGQAGSRLSKRHLTIAACVATIAGVLLVTMHGALGEDHAQTGQTHHVADHAPPAPPAPPATATPLRRQPAPQAQPPLTQPQLRVAVAAGRMSLAEVLARTDDTTKNAHVGWLLRALPGDGAAEIAALLTADGIDVNRRIGDLTEQQRRYLLHAVVR
jgi:zinc transporter ZupT